MDSTPPPASPSPPAHSRRPTVTASLLVVAIGLSMQTGSALAVKVIDAVGTVEALWLRTALAALILLIVRPRSLKLPGRGHRVAVAALTLTLLLMNLSFYAAISRAPVGIVVAIEFTGPLAVAVIGTRRTIDLVWVALAAVGVVLLAGPTGTAPAAGIALALVAAACWAGFLLLGKRAVSHMDPLPVTMIMLCGSALALTPALLVSGVRVAGHGHALLLGLAVAVLSSAFPYLLELKALSLVRASTYGVLLSLEPAIAALAGLVILSQQLTAIEVVAIAAVMAAAAGASWTAGDDALEPPPPAAAA